MPTDDRQPKASYSKNTKNFKIWFSPKSRKVRCCVKKPVAIHLPNGDREKPTTSPSPKPQDFSVFNFTSSSQESDSSSPLREKVNKKTKSKNVRPAYKQTRGAKCPKPQTSRVKREYKKLKLEAVNHQWGFGKDAAKESKNDKDGKVRFGDDDSRAGKKVSFRCMRGQPEEPQNLVSQGETRVLSLDESILDNLDETQNSDNELLTKNVKSPQPSGTLLEHSDDAQTTPERPGSSPGGRKRSLSRPSRPAEDPSHSLTPLNVKPVISPSERSSRRSLPHMKRNHMGETPLHLAAIKVCGSQLVFALGPLE